jgi:hypothetical protein
MSTGHIIIRRNIFVVVDDGKVPASRYSTLNRRLIDLAAAYKDGIGALVIIPENATPPPEDVRNSINNALKGLAGALRSFCWVVEGTGFQGAMVRGVLNGIRMFSRNSYPTFVTGNLDEALAWTLPHLGPGVIRSTDLAQARQQIRLEREGPPALVV